MVRCARLVWLIEGINIRLFFKRGLTGGTRIIVVIEQRDLIRVDMPFSYLSHLGSEAGVGESMVKIAELAVEYVPISTGSTEGCHKINVAGILQGNDRVFLGIGVQVTNDKHIGVAAAG